MVTLKVQVETSGKFFTGDTGGMLQKLTGAIVLELVQKGESRLDEVLRPRPAGVYLSIAEAQAGHGSVGTFRRSVNSRLSGLNARIQSNMIYGPWLEGISSRNATSRFKGYGMFRKTGQELEKQSGSVMTKHLNKFIRDLA